MCRAGNITVEPGSTPPKASGGFVVRQKHGQPVGAARGDEVVAASLRTNTPELDTD